MFSALVVLFRLVAGLVILAATWFVFDNIHDRNTEIIVATIGLLYSFIFIISGRLQYFGLTVFSFFGRTASYVQKIPYDHMMRDEVGLRAPGGSTFLNVVFAALIEGKPVSPGPEDALETLRLALAAAKSRRENRPVKISEIRE